MKLNEHHAFGAFSYGLQADSAEILCEVELPGVVRCVEWSTGGLCPRFACCCNGFKARPAAVSVYEVVTLGGISAKCFTSIEVPKRLDMGRWRPFRVLSWR